MKTQSLWLIGLCLAFSTAAAQQNHVNKNAGFSITIPKGWEIDGQGKMFLYLQTQMTPQGGLRCNLNINVEPLTENHMSGVEGSKIAARQIAQFDFNAAGMQNAKILMDQTTSVSSQPAYVVMLQGKNYLHGPEDGVIYQMNIRNKFRIYNVQFMCPVSSYNHYLKAFTGALQTLKIF